MIKRELSREEKIKKYKINTKNVGRVSLMNPDYDNKKSPETLSDLILEYARMYPGSHVYLEKEHYDDYGGCTCEVGLYLCYEVERTPEEIDQMIADYEYHAEVKERQKKINKEYKERQRDKIWRQLCKEKGIKLDKNGVPIDFSLPTS